MRNGKGSFSIIVKNVKSDLDGDYKDQDRNIKKNLSFVVVNYATYPPILSF